jgi:hypothetical protein
MAMRRRLWSVSALSVELNKDRRTVAKILDGVMPDGKERGHDAWHLETVLLALASWNISSCACGTGAKFTIARSAA